MYCKSCGKKILDDSKFCAYCGANIAISNNDEVALKISQDNPSGPETKDAPVPLDFHDQTERVASNEKSDTVRNIGAVILTVLVLVFSRSIGSVLGRTFGLLGFLAIIVGIYLYRRHSSSEEGTVEAGGIASDPVPSKTSLPVSQKPLETAKGRVKVYDKHTIFGMFKTSSRMVGLLVLGGLVVFICLWISLSGGEKVIENSRSNLEVQSPKEYQLTESPIPVAGHNNAVLLWSAGDMYDHGSKMYPRGGRVPVVTDGRFIEVEYRIDNPGKILQSTVYASEGHTIFSVIDDRGRIYGRSSIADARVFGDNVNHGLFSENKLYGFDEGIGLKPGIPYKFSVFFEVAKDSERFVPIVKIGLRDLLVPFAP